MMTTEAIALVGYVPGALGRIVELQARYYAEHWNLGLYFEAKAAKEMAEFLSRFDPWRDGAWFAKVGDEIVGGVFIDGLNPDAQGARLRWFILDPKYQGRGIGNLLMEAAMAFCKRRGFERVWLTTFPGLVNARHLYEKHGFRLHSETDGSHLTGTSELVEQVFELIL